MTVVVIDNFAAEGDEVVYMECFVHRGEPLPQASVEEHHIVPQAYGGPDIPTNVVIICANCHSVIHRLAVKLAAKAPLTGDAQRILEQFLPGQPARQERLWQLAKVAARAKLQHVRTGDIPDAGVEAEDVDTVKMSLDMPAWLHHRLKTLSVGTGLYRYVLNVLTQHAMIATNKPGAPYEELHGAVTPSSPDRPLILIDPTQPRTKK